MTSESGNSRHGQGEQAPLSFGCLLLSPIGDVHCCSLQSASRKLWIILDTVSLLFVGLGFWAQAFFFGVSAVGLLGLMVLEPCFIRGVQAGVEPRGCRVLRVEVSFRALGIQRVAIRGF